MSKPNHEEINPADPAIVVDSALLFFVRDLLPDEESKEWARAKHDEILSDISPDVLYATHEDGTRGLDPDYAGGFLLLMSDSIRHAKSIRDKRIVINDLTKLLGTRRTPKNLLEGKHGDAAQKAFLAGALMFAEICIQAELFEREIEQA